MIIESEIETLSPHQYRDPRLTSLSRSIVSYFAAEQPKESSIEGNVTAQQHALPMPDTPWMGVRHEKNVSHPLGRDLATKDSGSSKEDDFLSLVVRSRAYQWLLEKLRHESKLSSPADLEMTQAARLSEAVIEELEKQEWRYKQYGVVPYVSSTFITDWSPHLFLLEQMYDAPPEEAVAKALVLVGTSTRAEGLACEEYLARQWRESGPTFLQLVQSVVKSMEGTWHNGKSLLVVSVAMILMPRLAKLGDNTTLRATIHDGHFKLEARGFLYSVVEIGEQLMWISGALRSSDFATVGTSMPYFTGLRVTDPDTLSMIIQLRSQTMPVELEKSRSGTCWRELFYNPLLVSHYPILRQPSSALGLQLSLDSLMTLMKDARLITFLGRLFLKRFSTLLVAVKRLDDTILWHAISNQDGNYIQYHDERIQTQQIEVDSSLLQEVNIAELKHVVGWTSTATNKAGQQSSLIVLQLCLTPRFHTRFQAHPHST